MQETDRLHNLATLNSLEGKVSYAFSPRSYGNMSFPYGDRDEIIANRRRFLRAVGMDLDDIVFMRPVHKVNVAVVGQNDRGKGAYEQESGISSTDALITTEKGVGLAINAADCAPIIITHRKNYFLALAHAGREGTESEICKVTISELRRMGFEDLENFMVGIGPAIDQCYVQDFLQTNHVERWLPFVRPVDMKAKTIVERVNSIEPPIYKIRATSEIGEKVKLAIAITECNIGQLVKAGIPRENISQSDFCPACNFQEIFSHVVSARFAAVGQAVEYPEGRFMAVAQLKP